MDLFRMGTFNACGVLRLQRQPSALCTPDGFGTSSALLGWRIGAERAPAEHRPRPSGARKSAAPTPFDAPHVGLRRYTMNFECAHTQYVP